MRHPIPPYGVAIHQAISDGDLENMRTVAADAEAHVSEVTEALSKLRQEIARAESGKS
jgi:hypothetical protein